MQKYLHPFEAVFSKKKQVNKPDTPRFLSSLLPILPTRRPLIYEDGLVTLSVISHGHGDVITGLLKISRDANRKDLPRLSLRSI